MTELRQKMIRAMDPKDLSKHTQRTYLAAVNPKAHPGFCFCIEPMRYHNIDFSSCIGKKAQV